MTGAGSCLEAPVAEGGPAASPSRPSACDQEEISPWTPFEYSGHPTGGTDGTGSPGYGGQGQLPAPD